MIKVDNEQIKERISKAVENSEKGTVLMLELPTEGYFDACSATVRLLESMGYEGVYLSFQRPFKNVSALLLKCGVNIDKLLFVDLASGVSDGFREVNSRCIYVDDFRDIDEIVHAIYTSLSQLSGKKQYVFIDSLTTLALYLPLSEMMRFSEFLQHTIRNGGKMRKDLIFNVAQDLRQKKFIKDIAMTVDEVIA